MKALRVLYLMTFPLYGSGSGTYARYLAAQVQKSHETAIVCPDHRTIDGVKLYPLKLPFKVAYTGHPEWKKAKMFQDISSQEIYQVYKSYLESVTSAVEDFKPHILHVHHAFPMSWAARFIKSAYEIPYIITVHGSELPTAQKNRRYIALTIDALRRARAIVPNSFYTKDWMINIFGDEYRRQIRVIPGGVDLKRFRKVPANDIDKEFGLKDKKIVLFAGKLTPYKGVKYLVRAAKKIEGEVVILGDGSERRELERIVKEEKITNVQFLGHFAENTRLLVKFYSRADVFVAPSVWDEPLGLVILESMACETPVVVTRKGGIPLAVKDGKNGLFVKSRNIGDIAEKVNYLLQNDSKRDAMGKRARQIVEEKFSWQKIANRFTNYYYKHGNFKIYER